jgi:MoaA/NifB/PqqE/SkfB family radical SAM enzyme
MPLEILKDLCADFMSTEFPLKEYGRILSGGEPLLYSKFEQLCDLVREFQDHVILSTNGILIPEYVEQGVFEKKDGIQVSVDGDERTHDFIRGKGSYVAAVNALNMLDEHGTA